MSMPLHDSLWISFSHFFLTFIHCSQYKQTLLYFELPCMILEDNEKECPFKSCAVLLWFKSPVITCIFNRLSTSSIRYYYIIIFLFSVDFFSFLSPPVLEDFNSLNFSFLLFSSALLLLLVQYNSSCFKWWTCLPTGLAPFFQKWQIEAYALLYHCHFLFFLRKKGFEFRPIQLLELVSLDFACFS